MEANKRHKEIDLKVRELSVFKEAWKALEAAHPWYRKKQVAPTAVERLSSQIVGQGVQGDASTRSYEYKVLGHRNFVSSFYITYSLMFSSTLVMGKWMR